MGLKGRGSPLETGSHTSAARSCSDLLTKCENGGNVRTHHHPQIPLSPTTNKKSLQRSSVTAYLIRVLLLLRSQAREQTPEPVLSRFNFFTQLDPFSTTLFPTPASEDSRWCQQSLRTGPGEGMGQESHHVPNHVVHHPKHVHEAT